MTLCLPFVYFDKAFVSASETSTDLTGPASSRTDELIKGRTFVPLLALLDAACAVVAKTVPKIVTFDRVETFCHNTLQVVFHWTCQSPG